MSESVTLPAKKPLLALILWREGILSPAQLERALSRWQTRMRQGQVMAFGQIVIGLGLMGANELAPYLAMQKALAWAPGQRPLGRLLLENGLVRPSALMRALMRQRACGKRLGEVLLDAGLLKRPQLEILLRLQLRVA